MAEHNGKTAGSNLMRRGEWKLQLSCRWFVVVGRWFAVVVCCLSIVSIVPLPTAHLAGGNPPHVLWQGEMSSSGCLVLPASPMASAKAPLAVWQGRTSSARPGCEGAAPLWAEGPPGNTAPLWAEGSPCQNASPKVCQESGQLGSS